MVHQYIEALTILISPICPHWAQHVWGELLGKSGFVVDARWPAEKAVDLSLSRQKTYLQHAGHAFRIKVDESKKKLKTSTGLNGQILVAATYPKWQSAIITFMKSKYDESAEPKSLPDLRPLGPAINALEDVKSSKFAKQAMLVAAGVKSDFDERGVDAFDLKMPFNEIQLLKEQIELISRGMGLASIDVVEYEDGSQTGAKNIPLPGRPVLIVTAAADGAATDNKSAAAKKPEKPKAADSGSAAAGGDSAAAAGGAAKPAKADKKKDDSKKADKKGGDAKADKKKGGDKKKN